MTKKKPKVRYPAFYEETVGRLTKLTRSQDSLVARISDVDLVLPQGIEDKLRPHLGMRLGVLHTNIIGKEYLVRIIPERGKKTVLMTTAQERLLKDQRRTLCQGVERKCQTNQSQ